MSESLTGDAATTPASNEPTGQEVVDNTAETNQETISQEAVSDDSSTNQQNNDDGATVTDDGLASFAKSQGIEDVSELSERETKFLKIAQDNQKAYRSQQDAKKVVDTQKELTTPKTDATEDEQFRSEFKQFKYEQTANQFWSGDGRDKSLEPAMVDVLNEAKEKHGADYARTLSEDLGTLYDLARLKSGAVDTDTAKEQGRREERESIVRKQNASAPQAHAVSSGNNGTKVDSDWIANEYDPNNADHRKLVEDSMRSDLY